MNHKKIFLIDSLGAFISASLLLVIFTFFQLYIGMPATALVMLIAIALCFCIYSLTCFFFVNKNAALFLRAVSTANMLYCCLTLGLMVNYYPHLTILGLTYFLLEIVVIMVLVFFELRALKMIGSSN